MINVARGHGPTLNLTVSALGLFGEPVPSDRFPNRGSVPSGPCLPTSTRAVAGPITFELGAEVVLGHGMIDLRSFAKLVAARSLAINQSVSPNANGY